MDVEGQHSYCKGSGDNQGISASEKGRIIDLSFRFVALKDSVSLARRGTKFYGGLNIRMHTPKYQEISFYRDSLITVAAEHGQTSADYLPDQKLNQECWYCNIIIILIILVNIFNTLIWPGFSPPSHHPEQDISLFPGVPLVLRYRLLVHSGMKPDEAFTDVG